MNKKELRLKLIKRAIENFESMVVKMAAIANDPSIPPRRPYDEQQLNDEAQIISEMPEERVLSVIEMSIPRDDPEFQRYLNYKYD